MSSYCQLTEYQRYQIYGLKKEGHSQVEIAANVGVHPSTISRELSRNTGGCGYRPAQAQRSADERCLEAVSVKFTIDDWELVEEKIRVEWSPEQISKRFARDEILDISVERIYQHVWADKTAGGDLHTFLRSKKKYRKRYGSNDKRGKIKHRVSIEKRSKVVEKRTRVGDWEADLILGAGYQGAALTLTDRVTRMTLIKPVAKKQAEIIKEAINKALGGQTVLTITFDNGKEFALHHEVAKTLDTKTYFCDPYSSWQRGTNENTNGLIRQYLPKNRALNNLTQKECDEIMNKLNNRPRKCLIWATPNETVALQS